MPTTPRVCAVLVKKMGAYFGCWEGQQGADKRLWEGGLGGWSVRPPCSYFVGQGQGCPEVQEKLPERVAG